MQELHQELNKEIGEITEILSKWNDAKDESLDEVFPRVYENLKRLARKARKNVGRANVDETFSTTCLVNEMYLKLRKNSTLSFDSSLQFYALCRISMQNLLRDYYFKKSSKKHEVSLDDDSETAIENLINLSNIRASLDYSYRTLDLAIAFDEALSRLSIKHPRKAEVVVLKYYLDETDKEIAEHLGIGEASVRRDLMMSMSWIRNEIDNKMRAILAEAKDMNGTTIINAYLEKAAGDNKGFLKQLEIMLKEQKQG